MKAIAVALITTVSGIVFAQVPPTEPRKKPDVPKPDVPTAAVPPAIPATGSSGLAKLVKAQTEAIKELSGRVTVLEERVKKIESKR